MGNACKKTKRVFHNSAAQGSYFYNKEVIDAEIIDDAVARLLDNLLTGTANDTGSIRTEYAKIIRLQGASFREWVVPNEIVAQMEEATKGSQFGKLIKIITVPTNLFKGWVTTINPLRTIKFGMRNLWGDLDAVIAGEPKIAKYRKLSKHFARLWVSKEVDRRYASVERARRVPVVNSRKRA